MQHQPVWPKLPLEVVEPLCASFAKEADWILKLYDMTQGRPGHPGQCVNCFYALLGAARGEKRQALQPLREWIESNMEIAIKAGDIPAGRFPVLLKEPDLESFCEEAMRRARYDAVFSAPQIELSFSFKPQRAA